MQIGLVQDVLPSSKLESALRQEISLLLQTSPEAQAAYKKLSKELTPGVQSEQTAEAIATIRASQMGQHGLQSFFKKETPNWVLEIPEKVKLLIP